MLLQGDYYLYYNLLYTSTTYGVFILLTAHDTGPSVRQQLRRWIILHCMCIVKGEYRPYCSRYNVCIIVWKMKSSLRSSYTGTTLFSVSTVLF